jgi:hypothetical protein
LTVIVSWRSSVVVVGMDCRYQLSAISCQHGRTELRAES